MKRDMKEVAKQSQPYTFVVTALTLERLFAQNLYMHKRL